MTDRILTLRDLTSPGPPPSLYELRVLERTSRQRLADLDARVDAILVFDGPPTHEQIAAVDVLCAAIGEAAELLEELRRETALHSERHRSRRERPRRWV